MEYWILMLVMLGGSLLLIPHGSRSYDTLSDYKISYTNYLLSLMYFSLI